MGCLCIAGVFALCTVSLVASLALRNPKRPPATEAPTTELSQPPETFQEQAEQAVSHSEKMAELTRKANWQPLRNQLDRLRTMHASNVTNFTEINRLLSELLHSKDGKRIASDANLVEQFITIRDHDRMTQDELKIMELILDEFDKQYRDAIEDPTHVVGPDERLKASTADLETYHQQMANILAADLDALRTLVRRASSQTPSAMNLEQSVAEFLAKRPEFRAPQANGPQPSAADARRALFEPITDSSQESEPVDIFAVQERAEQALRIQVEQEERFKAALPEIRNLLSPMISRGNVQISKGGVWRPGPQGPVSLSAIKERGALELTPQGAHRMMVLFGPTSENDRHRGTFPSSYEGSQPKIRRAQELLHEFGDLMVEKGFLKR